MGTPLPTCFAAALGTRLILLGKLAKQEQRVNGSSRFRAEGSLVEELHADFEAKRIDFDTFEERKMELFARITVD